jgi:hypothetical protein
MRVLFPASAECAAVNESVLYWLCPPLPLSLISCPVIGSFSAKRFLFLFCSERVVSRFAGCSPSVQLALYSL